MGQVLIWVLFFAFFIRTVRNTLYQVFLWQIKEYRLDRMLVHLQTWQGKRMVFGPFSSAKWLLILFYLWGLPIFLAVVALFAFEAILNLREVASGIKRPIFTFKATAVVGAVVVGEILLFFWQPVDLVLWVLILDKLLSPTVALLFVGLTIPTKIQRGIVIAKAKEMIKKHPRLITIGITGSYGKTSTKEFLSSILSEKFKVLKTVGSNNTDIGVAKTIVENLRDQSIFVCEMAAYKRGEIKAICDIVRPKIGIITAINEQHLDLFGSLENTMATKYELIEALPKNGLAVFNGNNQYCQKLAVKARDQGIKTMQKADIYATDIYATDIIVERERLNFLVYLNEKKQQFSTNLLGKQNIENILASIAVARHLGMSLAEIAMAVEKLTPPEMTMKSVKSTLASILIDDTFNANPAGVLAALEYVKVYKGKKILVLQPMIELGSAAEQAHREVGEMAAKVCDYIFLTNKNFNKPFLEGMGKDKDKENVLILDPKTSAERIKNMVDNESVVVFEGKEAARVLAYLT
ncbi:hypothetical protein HY946_00295 [Candidatus Gottesmanbacteria bacterium]|nr:hypothetical protein [Candidatus Gottesmanbacteria bacterium]